MEAVAMASLFLVENFEGIGAGLEGEGLIGGLFFGSLVVGVMNFFSVQKNGSAPDRPDGKTIFSTCLDVEF